MAIIKRADKGSALTYNEMDANFDAVAPRDSATGAIEIPSGTTGQQPASPVVGQLRFNTQLNLFEGYFDTVGWSTLAASAVSGEVNQNAWAEIAVSGQSNVVADQKSDVLTFVAGTNIGITTNATGDSITFNNTFTQNFAYSSLTGAPTNVSAFTNDSGYLTSETTTTLTSDSVNTKLVYTDETGTANDVDLSWAIDDTNLARITSGSVDGGTGIATFSRDDASTFTVDFSALFDDTNLTRITSGSFNSSTGNLTLTHSDATTAATISLDGRYLTSYTETNDLSSSVTWVNVPDANITQSSVTQHQAALSITESQISDLQSYILLTSLSVGTPAAASGSGSIAYNNTTGVFTYTPPDLSSYLTAETNAPTAAVTWANVPDANITQSSVTQHQAALSITESQISDLSHYTNSNVDTHLNTSTATTGEVLSWTGTDYDWVAQSGGGGLANVVEDTTPQLGGTLDLNGNEIQNNGNIILHPTSTTGYVGINRVNSNGGTLLLNADQAGTPSSSSTNYSYIGVERGTSANVYIRWNETSDQWEFTNNGTSYTALGGSGSTPTLDTVMNTGSETDNILTLYRTIDGALTSGTLRFESRDNTPTANNSFGDIQFFGDTDADNFTNTLGEYARISVVGKEVGTTNNYGQIQLKATHLGTLTTYMRVGHTYFNPNSPSSVANRYNVDFPEGATVNGKFIVYDEVTNTADITSNALMELNFEATDSAGNRQTRAQHVHQNNFFQTVVYDQNELNPQFHYTALTQRPNKSGSMFTITAVDIDAGTTENFDIVSDYNVATKVWYAIYQPQGSDPPLRHANYTTTERNALIVGPGTVIWNTTDTKLQVYNGSTWENLH